VERSLRHVEVSLKHPPPAVSGTRDKHKGGILVPDPLTAVGSGIALIVDQATN